MAGKAQSGSSNLSGSSGSGSSNRNTNTNTSTSTAGGQGAGQGGARPGVKAGGRQNAVVRFMANIFGTRCHEVARAIPAGASHPAVGGQAVLTSFEPNNRIIREAATNIAASRQPARDASIQPRPGALLPEGEAGAPPPEGEAGALPPQGEAGALPPQGEAGALPPQGEAGALPPQGGAIPAAYNEATTARNADYTVAGQFAPIIVTGHGIPAKVVGGFFPMPTDPEKTSRVSPSLHAVTLGRRTPKQLVEHLVSHGLMKNYAGVIYLDGCYTATGQSGSFAAEVYRLLVKRGYSHLQVKGNLGPASTIIRDNEAIEEVAWPEAEWSIAQAKKREAHFTKARDKLIAKMQRAPAWRALEVEATQLGELLAGEGRKPRAERSPAMATWNARMLAIDIEKTALRDQFGVTGLKAEVSFWTKQVKALETKYEIIELVGTWGPEKLVRPPEDIFAEDILEPIEP